MRVMEIVVGTKVYMLLAFNEFRDAPFGKFRSLIFINKFIGVFDRVPWTEVRVSTEPGDRIFCYLEGRIRVERCDRTNGHAFLRDFQ